MAECVTLYRECFHTVWVYLPESLLHGGVCYIVSRVFSHCLGVSTCEPPAWRVCYIVSRVFSHCLGVSTCEPPAWRVCYTVSRVFSHCLGVST